jgi:biopolymer transport protein ExbB/TolQ
MAGEVEATLVAGGIKVALVTTAAGLVIAIPVNIAHNFFVSQIDSLIIDMRQGVETIHDILWTDAGPGAGAAKDSSPPAQNPGTGGGV